MEQFTSIHQKHFISMDFFFPSSSSFIRCAIFFLVLGKNAFFSSSSFYCFLSVPAALFFFAALLVFLLYLSLSFCLSRWLHWIDSKMLSDEIALCEKVRREYMNVNGDSESKTMIRLGLNALGNWFTTTFCLFFFSLVVVVVFGIFFAKKCEYFVVVAVWQVKILEWEYQ